MKIDILLKLCLFLTTLLAVSGLQAQETKTEEQHPTPPVVDNRGALLRHLGLTREQVQQIRRMNVERKPLMDAAQLRVREATKQLDDAIYADNVAESEVQEKLKALQLAQAEVSRIRFMNELAVRRILTPEQLVKFRELRQRFEAARENFQNQRGVRDANAPDTQNPTTNSRPLQNNQNERRMIRQQQQPAEKRP